MRRRKGLSGGGLLFALVVVAVLLGVDQLSKLLAIRTLAGRDARKLLPGIFHLYYLENHGAAFGILKGQVWLLLLAAVLIVLLVLYGYLRLPADPYYLPLRLAGLALAAGGLGNAVDRIFRGYVVDFFYFCLIDFPVFNVADIYVVVGTAVLCFLLLFYYKEKDLEPLFAGKEKTQK